MWIKVGKVDRFEQGELVPVRRCAFRRQAEQYGLVLAAMGIQSSITRDGDSLALSVGHRDAARATYELAAYDHENRDIPPPSDKPLLAPPRLETALVFWAVLLFFFAAARHEAFSFDWLDKGAAQSGLMLDGAWWRAVTALCLHASSIHLLGNLVFGTLFLLLLAQLTGAGVAALSMVAAGAVGNVLNALVQVPQHTSIGASTAIFAALGIIVVLRQSVQRGYAFAKLRNWTPLGGGLALLAFLGFSGENTDILAHVIGFGSGLATGFLLSRWGGDGTSRHSVQWTWAGTAALVVAAAWAAAALA